jgi:hypothetical protein
MPLASSCNGMMVWHELGNGMFFALLFTRRCALNNDVKNTGRENKWRMPRVSFNLNSDTAN